MGLDFASIYLYIWISHKYQLKMPKTKLLALPPPSESVTPSLRQHLPKLKKFKLCFTQHRHFVFSIRQAPQKLSCTHSFLSTEPSSHSRSSTAWTSWGPYQLCPSANFSNLTIGAICDKYPLEHVIHLPNMFKIKALKWPAKSFWLTALLSGCFWSLSECTGFSSQEVSSQSIFHLPALSQV